ncbi:hypothetical protein ANO11243_034890 [Dothideomycetidae sp. 11243]|nr:hypothetical protein ANO11243_034890 [fungal sp. No.11243]
MRAITVDLTLICYLAARDTSQPCLASLQLNCVTLASAYSRTKSAASPIFGLTSKHVLQGCRCVLSSSQVVSSTPPNQQSTSVIATSSASEDSSEPSAPSTDIDTTVNTGLITSSTDEIITTMTTTTSSYLYSTTPPSVCGVANQTTTVEAYNARAGEIITVSYGMMGNNASTYWTIGDKDRGNSTSWPVGIGYAAAISSCAVLASEQMNCDDQWDMAVWKDVNTNDWTCLYFADSDTKSGDVQSSNITCIYFYGGDGDSNGFRKRGC